MLPRWSAETKRPTVDSCFYFRFISRCATGLSCFVVSAGVNQVRTRGRRQDRISLSLSLSVCVYMCVGGS